MSTKYFIIFIVFNVTVLCSNANIPEYLTVIKSMEPLIGTNSILDGTIMGTALDENILFYHKFSY